MAINSFNRQVRIREGRIDLLLEIYRKAYARIVREIIDATEAGKIQRARVMARINRELQSLAVDVNQWVNKEIPQYYLDGANLAVQDLRALGVDVSKSSGMAAINREAIKALTDDTALSFAQGITALSRNAQRILGDALKQQINLTIAEGRLSGDTRKMISSAITKRLEDEGISALTDRAGKNWTFENYSEMLARTKAVEARNQGLANRMLQNGYDLVQVSDHNSDHQACADLEGEILSLTGSTPKGTELAGGLEVWGSLVEAIEAGLFHPRCFEGDTLVAGFTPEAGFARWYEGKMVVLETASGVKLSVTPNHPILTTKGWIAAGSLVVGNDLIRSLIDGKRKVGSMAPDYEQVPAPIKDVFATLNQISSSRSVRVPVAPKDFHGDGIANSNVDIVFAKGFLLGDREARQALGKGMLKRAGMKTIAFSNLGQLNKLTHGMLDIFRRLVSRFSNTLALLKSRPGHPEKTSPTSVSHFDAFIAQAVADSSHVTAKEISQFLYGRPGLVTPDKLINVDIKNAACHVYNLFNKANWYTANSIISHNCEHAINVIEPELAAKTEAYDNAYNYKEND